MHGLDERSAGQIGHHGIPVRISIKDRKARRGKAGREPHQLGAPLVHADGRRHHATAGIGNPHQLERPLNRTVLAATAMQGDEGALVALLLEDVQVGLGGVEGMGIHTSALQRRQHGTPRHQGDLALGGASAQQYRHFSELTAHVLRPRHSPVCPARRRYCRHPW
jgi:hypothetical protein